MTTHLIPVFGLVRGSALRMCAGLALVVATVPLIAGANESSKEPSRPSASAPPARTASAFQGTAYLRTSNTILFAGKSYGASRASSQGLIDQCNGFAKSYGLLPRTQPELVMAALDVIVQEKYFDTDRALTLRVGHLLVLPDMRRWADELKLSTSGAPPSVPPDCSKTEPLEVREGTLWRDGLAYELRYQQKKALARRARPIPPLPGMAEAFEKAPKSHYLGETCRDLVGGVDVPGEGNTCFWDLFPYVNYLNWPYVLSGRHQFGPVAVMFETVETLAVEHGHSIPASVFEIPDGFTVTGP